MPAAKRPASQSSAGRKRQRPWHQKWRLKIKAQKRARLEKKGFYSKKEIEIARLNVSNFLAQDPKKHVKQLAKKTMTWNKNRSKTRQGIFSAINRYSTEQSFTDLKKTQQRIIVARKEVEYHLAQYQEYRRFWRSWLLLQGAREKPPREMAIKMNELRSRKTRTAPIQEIDQAINVLRKEQAWLRAAQRKFDQTTQSIEDASTHSIRGNKKP